MKSIIILPIIIGGWVILNAVILPKLGFRT